MKTYKIALIGGDIKQTGIIYNALNEEDCKELFMANNTDLDETDFWVHEVKE